MPEAKRPEPYPDFHAMALRVILSAGLALLLAAVLLIPAYFPTTTLWYKIGLDKTLLIGGHIVGLFALTLLFLQVVLSVRGGFLEQVFGAAALTRGHRLNGLLVGCLALCHVMLVLVPEGLANLPIGKKFWPEMVGAVLLLAIAVQVVTSSLGPGRPLPFRLWRTIHRLLGYLALPLATVHVLFVSDSFEQPLPRLFLLALFLLVAGWLIGLKARGRRSRRGP